MPWPIHRFAAQPAATLWRAGPQTSQDPGPLPVAGGRVWRPGTGVRSSNPSGRLSLPPRGPYNPRQMIRVTHLHGRTARWWPWTTFPLRSGRTKPWGCWAPTGPARPRPCTCSWGCSGRTEGDFDQRHHRPDASGGPASDRHCPRSSRLLYDDLTVRENLMFFGRLYSMHGRRLRGRVAAVLERGRSPSRPGRWSRRFQGMQRRLQLACPVA